MRARKSNGVNKILLAGLGAAALSFTLTGVVESAVSGVPSVKPAALDMFRQAADLSAMLAIPDISFDRYATPADNSEKNTEQAENNAVPQSSTSSTGSISQPEQTSAPQQTSPPHSSEITDDTQSTPESVVDVILPVQPSTNLISQNIRSDKNDLEQYTANDGVIEERTYGEISGDFAVQLYRGQLRNNTAVPNDEILSEGCKTPDIKIELNGEPQVLIMHTHTTESYEPSYEDGHYDNTYSGRSLCPANSVVGVGAVISQKLADYGICTIHDGTVFDDPVYSNSYSRSYDRIQEILEQYPSIKVVLDIHRDGIAEGDVRIAPVAEINGKKAAQIMIICGCDDGSGMLPDYMENLRFATFLQTNIEESYPGLMRPLLFDYRYYNQDITTGSLLIEVGALGNSTEQAKYSGELIGEAIAKALLKLS